MKLLLARYLVPVATPVIEDGAILIDGNRIVAIGDAATLRRGAPPNTAVDDLGDVALLPGFVNPHTHLELTGYAGAIPAAKLWDWFGGLLALRTQPGAIERERSAIRDGARQSLASGVTLIGDISRTGLSAAALAGFPIRRVCYAELISGASLPPSTFDELADTAARLRDAYADDFCTIGLSPHAPYTVTLDDYANTIALAAREGLPLTMHLLETPEEAEWLRGKRGYLSDFLTTRNLANAAMRPDGLHRYLNATVPMLLAHVNYANDAEIDQIAAAGVAVVWCPRAHAFFGHENHPWRRLLAAGVNVCVGTDSLASNTSLSILDELRFVRAHFPEVVDDTILRLGTMNGAAGLGFASEAGALVPGAWADLCAIPCDVKRSDDVIRSILTGENQPSEVWIDGERPAMPAIE